MPSESPIIAALDLLRFRVQGFPQGQPTSVDTRLLRNGEAFAFITDIGNLDIRFRVDGIGDYDEVLRLSEDQDFDGRIIRMLSINGLIQSKKAMARPQDLQALPELEMMQEAEAVRRREAAHEEGNT